jgi:hypothetical protein
MTMTRKRLSKVLPMLFFAACTPSVDDVREAIGEANHCETVDDCVDLGAQCPFGCSVLVNASEADAIGALIEDYLSGQSTTCSYGCPSNRSLLCEEGVCTDTGEIEG